LSSVGSPAPTRGIDWEAIGPLDRAGLEMHELMQELYPLCRSLSGDGVRETLRIVGEHTPLELTEVPTGERVFDWTVPEEWNIRDAWIAGDDGRRIVDFRESNLHVLSYSVPIRARLRADELREHVFTHPEQPEWVPYRTSYYNRTWGFCVTQRQLEALADGEFDVCIDSTVEPGSITYGESFIPGATNDEVLLSTYVCHPSLCNDNLSGIVLLAMLGKHLRRMNLRHSYRLLFSPGTIGPLSWLARNEDRLERVKHGLVVSCVGDPGRLTYKRSRRGNAEIDQAVTHVLRSSGDDYELLDFVPWGGDERQFCSPGIDLPVGALSRTPADRFPEYHSSADDLEFVRPEYLADSLEKYLAVLDVLETNGTFLNLSPKGEPQLGKRGLYRSVGGGSSREIALFWVLNQSDGTKSLLDIADRAGIPFADIREAAQQLHEHDLLAEA
jgi:aminopeptidase-like protein